MKTPFLRNLDHPWALFGKRLVTQNKLRSANGREREKLEEELKNINAEIRKYAEDGVAWHKRQKASGKKAGEIRRQNSIALRGEVIKSWRRLERLGREKHNRSRLIADGLGCSLTTVHTVLDQAGLRLIKKRK